VRPDQTVSGMESLYFNMGARKDVSTDNFDRLIEVAVF
jgi:hypothetical protein